MTAVIFNGKQVAAEIEEKVREEIEERGLKPTLVWLSMGDVDENALYGSVKKRAAERVGIEFREIHWGNDWKLEQILSKIEEVNDDESVDGLMVQLPVVREGRRVGLEDLLQILNTIKPEKDVDCLTAYNLGLVVQDQPRFLPATVSSVLTILRCCMQNLGNEDFERWIFGKRVTILGGGLEVGRPLAAYLSNLGASIIWLRSSEERVADFLPSADVIVSATGVAGIVQSSDVKSGAIVIDVASPVADVDFEQVKEKAAFITSVPGGVGPVTVASLMENVLKAAGTSVHR